MECRFYAGTIFLYNPKQQKKVQNSIKRFCLTIKLNEKVKRAKQWAAVRTDVEISKGIRAECLWHKFYAIYRIKWMQKLRIIAGKSRLEPINQQQKEVSTINGAKMFEMKKSIWFGTHHPMVHFMRFPSIDHFYNTFIEFSILSIKLLRCTTRCDRQHVAMILIYCQPYCACAPYEYQY